MVSPWVFVAQFVLLMLVASVHFHVGNTRTGIVFTITALATVVLIVGSIHTQTLRRQLQALQSEAPLIADPQHYGLIHKPKTGCPAGFVEVPDIFERAGVKSPGCFNPNNRSGPIDVLMPGETVFLPIAIIPTEPTNPPQI